MRRDAVRIRVLFASAAVSLASPAAGAAPADGSARIEKPRALTVPGGFCRVSDGGKTFSGVWGPDKLPPLAFTVGPGSAMADALHASKAPFSGPGVYRDVVVAVYLGKTALEDVHAGLGTVTVQADGRSGTFALNDGTTSGTWSCGNVQR